MGFRWSFGLVALLPLLSGCLPSEHGLCPPDGGDQAVFDPALLGDWAVVADDPARPGDGLKVNLGGKMIRIERLGDGSTTYRISTTAGAGMAASEPPTLAHLVPIGGARFLDVLIGDPNDDQGSRHALLKVSGVRDGLTFHLMDPVYVMAGRTALATSALSFSGRIPAQGQRPEVSVRFPTLTDPTPELRKFLAGHANDPELWPADWTVRCRRVSTRPGPDQPTR